MPEACHYNCKLEFRDESLSEEPAMKDDSSTSSVKEQVQKLVDNLSDDASWDDLMRQIYVLQSIEKGLEDSDAGRVVEVNDVRSRYGLDQ